MKATSICAFICVFTALIYTGITTHGYMRALVSDTNSLENDNQPLKLEQISPSLDTIDINDGKATRGEEEEDGETYLDGLLNIMQGKNRKKELNLVVIGDFGYLKGKEYLGTKELADVLFDRITKRPGHYDFVLSVGDILYNIGVESRDDPKPRILFEDVFKIDQMGLDWYSTLGNHDCIGDFPATFELPEKFPLWKQSEPHYTKIFNIGSSHLKAGFIFLNGCELVCLRKESYECYTGTHKNINFDHIQDQIDWLEETLSNMAKDNTIAWKVIVIHFGIFSAGVYHGDNPELKKAILPILVKYKVDVVLSGHDHSVQYLRMDMDSHNNLQQDTIEILDSETAKAENVHKTTEEATNAVKCPDEVHKNKCSFDEFFYYELTECGIVKKEDQISFLRSESHKDKDYMINLEEMNSRESLSNQHEHLHQFIFGNGGIKVQKMCPFKQQESQGKLRYGNTGLGFGEIKIKEDSLEVSMVTTKDEILYTVKISRERNNDEEL